MNLKPTIPNTNYLIFFMFFSQIVLAQDQVYDCVTQQYEQGEESLTLNEIRNICQSKTSTSVIPP